NKQATTLGDRYASQIKFVGSDDLIINAPKVKQIAIDLIKSDPEFMKSSNANSAIEPSGKYPVGDVVLTGAAVKKENIDKVRYYLNQKAAGHASPNIILVARPELAPLFTMRNKLLTPEDIRAGNYAVDPNPGSIVQGFGVVKNPDKGGITELVDLGFIPSNHRLNVATGKDHTAFNKHPAVLAGKMEPYTPENHKSIITKAMDRQDVESLIVSVGKNTTAETISSGNPHIHLILNEAAWQKSLALRNYQKTQPSTNPVSVDIARINNANKGTDMNQKIQAMKNNPNITKPASEYIPRQVIPENAATDSVLVHREATRTVAQKLEKIFDVADPAQVKSSFFKDFGITLTDAQAAEIFNKRTTTSMVEGINTLLEVANTGNPSLQTKVGLDFVKTYLESGALAAGPNGKAVLDMPLVVPKNYSERLTPEPVTRPAVNEPTVTQSTVTQPTDTLPPIIPVTPTSKLGIGKVKILPEKRNQSVEATERMLENEARQNRTINEEQPYFSGRNETTPEAFAYDKWMEINGGKVPGNKSERQRLVNEIAAKMEEEFQAMEGGMAWAFTSRALPELSGMTSDYVKPPLKTLGSSPGGYSQFIEGGLKMNPLEKPQAYYFAKAFDKGLQDMLGKNYKKIPRLSSLLDDYFKNITSRTQNIEGKEITQPEDVLKYRATGERSKEIEAYKTRTVETTTQPAEQGGELSPQELAKLGVQPEGEGKGLFGMNVRPEHQDINMVRDLTAFENLIGGLFSTKTKQTGSVAVEAVKDLFMGDRITQGLREYILSRMPSAKRSVSFDKLIAEARANDIKVATLRETNAPILQKTKQELRQLEGERAITEEALANPSERASWQQEMGDEVLTDIVTRITEKMMRAQKIIAELEALDGGGGPGIHDGAGGVGDFFSNLGRGLKTFPNNLIDNFKALPAASPIIYKNATGGAMQELGKYGNLISSFTNPNPAPKPAEPDAMRIYHPWAQRIRPPQLMSDNPTTVNSMSTPSLDFPGIYKTQSDNRVNQLVSNMRGDFPFTPHAQQILDKVPYRRKEYEGFMSPQGWVSPNRIGGAQNMGGEWPASMGGVAILSRAIDEKTGGDSLLRIGQRFDPMNITTNENEDYNNPEGRLAHESLHALYQTTPLFDDPSEWNNLWDDLKVNGTPYTKGLLDAVDQDMEKSSMYDLSNPYSLGTERFAYLGEQAMTRGLTFMPPELKGYYVEFIEERPTLESPNRTTKPLKSISKPLSVKAPPGPIVPKGVPRNILLPLGDGEGGPGIHDGAGGFFGDLWSRISGKTGKIGKPIEPKSYNVRGVNVTEKDIKKLVPIITLETSSREEKEPFETQIIFNTAINRALANSTEFGGSNISNVFTKPQAYQAYAPEGSYNKQGQPIKSKYQKFFIEQAPLKESLEDQSERLLTARKNARIEKILMEYLNAGKFDDTIGGAQFYVHATDGTIWYGATGEEAQANAYKHEKELGLSKSPFGAIHGAPVQLVKRP
ncbi:MAG: hypothetical protein NUV96_01715, partial [Candidatus Colwellbacteria bacterium]|nr:hypothetical protein [Candidatus Colwellbacteria bacterium]